jgi:hypothetical protein
MASLSPAWLLEGLSPSHHAFQGHAAHPAPFLMAGLTSSCVNKGCNSSRIREPPSVNYAACSCPVGASLARSSARSLRITRPWRPRSPAMSVPTPPRVASYGIRCERPRPSGSWWRTPGSAPSRCTSLKSCGACRRHRSPWWRPWHEPPYARDVAAVEEAVRQAVGQEVSAALHAYRDGDEVVITHCSHLVQAQVA